MGNLDLNFINSSSEGSTKIGLLIAIGPKNLCTKFQLSSPSRFGAIAGQSSRWNALEMLEMECRQSVSHISGPPPRQPPSPEHYTRSSAIAEGPRDASCQLKSCQLPLNTAETTYTTSPDQIDGMKLEI